VSSLLALVSWRGWGIIRYNSIWQNLAGLFYIALSDRLFTLGFIGQVGLFLVFSTLMTAFGYLINDLADLELDRRHGKPNFFHRWDRSAHPRRLIWIPMAVLVGGSLFALPFLGRPWFVWLWMAWLLLTTSYSLPPLRLKERGLIGLAATIGAQQTLPTMLVFAAFGELVSWGALAFVVFATARGISSDLGHQMRDWSRDASTATTTFAVKHGYRITQTLYAISLETERLALGTVIALLFFGLPAVRLPLLGWEVDLASPLVLIYVLLLVLTLGRSWRALRQGQLAGQDPYSEERQARVKDALYIIHHPFPTVVLPLYLAIWLTIFWWPNAVFIAMLVLLYRLYDPGRWADLFRGRALLTRLRTR
jgi:4-hydroxybenzoate polyprenyltransferase